MIYNNDNYIIKKGINMKQSKYKKTVTLLIAGALLLTSSSVLAAEDIGSIFSRLTGFLDTIFDFFVKAIGLLGAVLGYFGARMAFWPNESDQQAKQQGKNAAKFIVGAIFCISFWFIVDIVNQSAFNTTDTKTNTQSDSGF